MAEQESPQSREVEHSYLDVAPGGPRAWILVVGALLVGLAILGGFYGLYTLNRASPTFTPDPARLTQVALAGTSPPQAPSATPSPSALTFTPTVSPAVTLAPTTEPPTYTVRQGDTLIGIASRLNVNPDDLARLNGVSGETIYPDQVLSVPPTVTPWPESGPFPHTVSAGETLLSIAALYQVSVDEIKSLNGLTSDNIFSGQRILIPASGVRPPTPTPVPPTPTPWQSTVVTDALDLTYALTVRDPDFRLHFRPGTRAATADDMVQIGQLIEQALDLSRATLQRRPSERIDVYVADTLFAAPHTHRRSFSRPEENRLFLLHDGSGTPAERLYFATYAVTQLAAAQTLGEPATPLLEEGLAVHAAGQALGGRYLSPDQFCAAYQAVGRLPRVSRSLEFEGHLGHLDRYFAAGCFVGFLIEQEGAAAFDEVYAGGDFVAVYGRTLNQLELEWIAALQEAAGALPFDPQELARVVTDLDDAYRRLWAEFEVTERHLAAYGWLDRARILMLQGRLEAARKQLDAFETSWSER